MTAENKKGTVIFIPLAEAGFLMGLIESREDIHKFLPEVRRQMAEYKESIERKEGVVKTFGKEGYLTITDKAGNTMIRPPQKWELDRAMEKKS